MKEKLLFLLPSVENLCIATIEDKNIKILRKTIFPSRSIYSVSDNGLVTCLDKENNLIIIGIINNDASCNYIKIINYPSHIIPYSTLSLNNVVVFGGSRGIDFSDINYKYSNYSLVSYSIYDDVFKPIAFPLKKVNGESIIKILKLNNTVYLVYCFLHHKYLIEYDFQSQSYPCYKSNVELSNNLESEIIIDSTINETYFATLSLSFTIIAKGRYITIYNLNKKNNKTFIYLEQYYLNDCTDIKKRNRNCCWNKILLFPTINYLFIVGGDEGIGIYKINSNKFHYNQNNDTKKIGYIKFKNKGIKDILRIPNDSMNIILCYYEKNEIRNTSYEVVSIKKLITKYEKRIITLNQISSKDFIETETPFMEDQTKFTKQEIDEFEAQEEHFLSSRQSNKYYDPLSQDDFCDRCQQSPCMCSDPGDRD